MPMSRTSRLGDYLDLEWFLEKDRALDLGAIQSRDRALGLEAQKHGLSPGQYFHFWLNAQRQAALASSPSLLWSRVKKLLLWLVLFFGFMAGFSLVRGLLQYFGLHPVNVSVFLLVAVFPQFALSFLAAIFLMLRCFMHKKIAFPWIFLPILSLLRLGARWIPQGEFLRSMLVMGRYTSFLAWEVMMLMHIAAISLAAGSLLGMLGSVAVTDLAFGWQSTLTSGVQGMERVVAVLSWPWSWLPTSWELVPSPEHIAGSRIILKEGITGLVSSDLVAWWPFLSLCLFFYALVPRGLLVLATKKGLLHLEKTFVHPDELRITDRMQAPLIDHVGQGEPQSSPLPVHSLQTCSVAKKNQGFEQSLEPLGCVLVLPPELEDCILKSCLDNLVQQVSGYPLGAVVTAELEEKNLENTLRDYKKQDWIGGHERYAFLIEAWQPPIREALAALAHWGNNQKGTCSLFVILVGRPQSGQWLTPPSDIEERVWRQALDRLAPLRVDILTIATMEKP